MSLTTNGYHPVARCDAARDLYFEWVKFEKGEKQFAYKKAKYVWHLAKCKCREGLDDTSYLH